MLTLTLLGTLECLPDFAHPDAAGLLAKPKPTALLIYLLLHRPGAWHRRDELASVFWPESDQQHARRALSQAVYQIRQHLGTDVIASRGAEDLRVEPGAIATDVAFLRADLAAGRLEAALQRYTGDLLPAFHVHDAPQVMDWLDMERVALRRRMVDAAERLAATSDNLRHWHRWAVEHDPLNHSIAARAVAALAGAGHRADALDVFELHRAALERELEIKPDAGLVAAMRRLGSSSVPIEISVPSISATAPDDDTTSREGSPRTLPQQPWYRRPRLVATAAVVLLVLILATRGRPPAPAIDSEVIAVLPVAYAGVGDGDDGRYLAELIPIGLIDLLDGSAGLHAVSQQRIVLALDRLGRTWREPLQPEEARRLADNLGAGRYLVTTILADGTRKRLVATVMRTETGEPIGKALELDVDSLQGVEAVDRLYAELLIQASGQGRRVAELITTSTPALRAYVTGMIARRERRYLDALRSFDEAMTRDSTFALAALAYREVSLWFPDGSPHPTAVARADSTIRRHPDRLSPADRAIADALIATYRKLVDGDSALRLMRHATIVGYDRPSAWMLLGDFLLHDGAMQDIPNHLDLAAVAFDSVLAQTDAIPEAERHMIEIRLASRDTSYARTYLRSVPHEPGTFDDRWWTWWTAASLVGDRARLAAYARALPHASDVTWRFLVLWAERTEAGFEEADHAEAMLRQAASLDEGMVRNNLEVVQHYTLNRGRPARFLKTAPHGFEGRAMPSAIWYLQGALAAPPGWLPGDSLAAVVASHLDSYTGLSRFLGRCQLGLWLAAHGGRTEAGRLARSLARWQSDPDDEVRAYARNCSRIIHAALDDSPGLDSLRAVAEAMRREPRGLYRREITGWNLYLADRLAARGDTAAAVPLTTRRGCLVEGMYWTTPALLREADWSLALGDTTRAARTYARLVRFLDSPDPALHAEAVRVRELARRLAAHTHIGPASD